VIFVNENENGEKRENNKFVILQQSVFVVGFCWAQRLTWRSMWLCWFLSVFFELYTFVYKVIDVLFRSFAAQWT